MVLGTHPLHSITPTQLTAPTGPVPVHGALVDGHTCLACGLHRTPFPEAQQTGQTEAFQLTGG